MHTAAAHHTQNTTECATLFVAFELSQKKWKLGFSTGMGQRPRVRTIEARDMARVLAEIAAAKRRFGLAEGVPVVSCYEAGRDGFWLHRALAGAGVNNHVVDSSSIQVDRRARRAKTDGLDVGRLLLQLIRHQGGERGVWRVVNVPDEQAEDARHAHRDLASLKQERAREVNRIKALLATQGVVLSTRGKGDIDLERVRQWDGNPLAAGLQQRIGRAQQRLAFLEQQIREIEGQRAQEVAHAQGPEIDQVRALMALKGIGPVSSFTMTREFFTWRRFRNRRQVGALAGLAPTPYQSGDSAREQGISKAGNRSVRACCIEMAWMWVRHQPGSPLTQWFQERFGHGPSRQRRIGIVALARKLLIVLWRYLETGELPHGAIVKG